jgi:hypothetical protein
MLTAPQALASSMATNPVPPDPAVITTVRFCLLPHGDPAGIVGVPGRNVTQEHRSDGVWGGWGAAVASWQTARERTTCGGGVVADST